MARPVMITLIAIGFDLPLLGREFIMEKQTLIRGLAHPAIFLDDGIQGTANANTSQPAPLGSDGFNSLFKTFGAVEVSPGSIYEVGVT